MLTKELEMQIIPVSMYNKFSERIEKFRECSSFELSFFCGIRNFGMES